MNFKDVIQMAITEYMNDLHKALEGLSKEERRFQPDTASNHIDFTVWHMARVEDEWIHGFAKQTDTIWKRDKWYKTLNLPEDESGYKYSSQQVVNFPDFDFNVLMNYYSSVSQATLQYLNSLDDKTLNTCPDNDRLPGYTIGKMFGHVIVEESQHLGQIAYLRGLQRGLNN